MHSLSVINSDEKSSKKNVQFTKYVFITLLVILLIR